MQGIKEKLMKPASPLKVCYFLKWYPRLSQTFILNEILSLQQQGISITIVALKSSDEVIVHERVKAVNIPVYYLPTPSSIPNDFWKIRFLERLNDHPHLLGLDTLRGELSSTDYLTLIQAAMITPLLQRLGIDHIHAHFATWATTLASFVSSMTGIPYSFTAHARDIYHKKVKRKTLAEKIENAGFVITVSDFNKRFLETLLQSEGKSGKVIRLYNGIDLELFKPANVVKEPNLLVGVGRLVQKKGFKYLIDACRILKERGRHFSCVIIGEGEERASLEKQLAQYSLEKEVLLVGARSQTDVIQTLQKAELCILPCLIGDDGDRDGLPTVLLESIALGVPVISTNITGIPEIISHEQTGLLVKEKDPKALADAIERLLDSETLCKRLSESAMSKARSEFDLTKNVQKLRGYFLPGVGGS